MYLAIESRTKKQLVCKLVNLDKLQGKARREEVRRKFQEADVLRQLHHVRSSLNLFHECNEH